ncbi:MAG: HlyD family secretion protein [Candidatus Tectomicrobia bacterium]|nr:HlyD family secretion protein [Candidatus Tectomicrobia bacterium]
MLGTHDATDDITLDSMRPPSPRKPRRLILWGVVALLMSAGLLLGVRYYLYAIAHESTDDAFVEGQIVPIGSRVAGQVLKVHVRDNQWVDAGDLLVELDPAEFQVRLAAAEAALRVAHATQRSRRITVDLTTITSSAGVDEATGNVQTARATIERAKALVAGATSQRSQARARLAAARAELEQARAELLVADARYRREHADLQRVREMVKTGIAATQQLDHAAAAERMAAAALDAARRKVDTQEAAVEQSRAALRTAEDNLLETQAQVSARNSEMDESKARFAAAKGAPQQAAYRRAELEVAEAESARAEAEAARARLDLSYTKITAPSAGNVTRKAVEAGSYVQVGQALLAIVQSQLWVLANFKETQLTRMRPGQAAEIEIDTYPGVVFAGRVDSIQRGTGARFSLLPPDNATGNFVKVVQRVPVKIVFNDPQQLRTYLLVPGMSVIPVVSLAPPDRAAASPAGGASSGSAARSQGRAP